MHNNKANDDEKTEPKENDKWVENNDHDKDSELNPKISRLDELRGRAKKFASNRYHVIIVLLCVLLFILFIIVIALAVQLGTYSCLRSNECRTPQCLRSASLVVERSDFASDPCQDFWSYSCKGWIHNNPLPSNKGLHSVTDDVRQVIYGRVRHLIDLVPHDADDTSHQWKVKYFYSSCMNLENIEYWFPNKISEAIHEIGGWAIVNDAPGGSWSRNEALKKLHVSFGVSPFFKVLVEADDLRPVTNIIKLVPGGLGLPSPRYYFKPHDDLYVRSYKEFIKNVMQELEVSLHDASKFAEEVFHYERRIAEATPNPEILRNTKDLYVKLKVKELDRLSSSIPWTDFLQAYFPDVVGPETEVAVLSEAYFRDISKIISSTDNSVLNNYYMWRFMHTYGQYSSSKFRLAANHFKQTLEGVSDLNLKHEENWKTCIDLTSQFLGHAIGAMYVEKYVPGDSQDKFQVYLHKLIGALHSVSHNIQWLKNEETTDSAQSKIRSLTPLIGHPSFSRNQTVGTHYKELKVQKDFFQNMKAGVYFLHKKQEEMLKRNAVLDFSWTVYSYDVSVDYKYIGNQLVVPAGLLDSPFFHEGAPLPVKYGALAAHLANKLGEIFDDKGVNYDIYGTLSPWMSNDSMLSFKRRENCLKTSISNYSIHGVGVEPELVTGSLIAEIGGVKVAYQAFKSHAKENEEGSLPGTDVSADQLFFISYAQSLCQAVREKKLMATKDANTHLPAELRVLSTLQQMSEFSTSFSCPSNSRMNPSNRCYMW